jgi:hypothetical protein
METGVRALFIRRQRQVLQFVIHVPIQQPGGRCSTFAVGPVPQ